MKSSDVCFLETTNSRELIKRFDVGTNNTGVKVITPKVQRMLCDVDVGHDSCSRMSIVAAVSTDEYESLKLFVSYSTSFSTLVTDCPRPSAYLADSLKPASPLIHSKYWTSEPNM